VTRENELTQRQSARPDQGSGRNAAGPWLLAVPAAVAVAALAMGSGVAQAAVSALVAFAGFATERARGRRAAERDVRRGAAGADLESRRETTARLLSLELGCDRANSVLDALGEGVVVVDIGGEVVLANPAARRVLARPDQGPEGRLLWEVLCPELAPRAQDAWRGLCDREAGGSAKDAGLPIRCSGVACSEGIFDLTAVRARSPRTGQDFGSVFLFVDATRSHELQQLKDRFLSSVSHELRTPLTNICAYAEILASLVPGETAEWPEFVRVIHSEGVALSTLVDRMFDYLQLESGEAAFRFEDADAAPIVRDAVERIRERAVGVRFDLQLDPAPPVRVDRERLGQVVTNLLENAVKFTPAGGAVRVHVGARDGACRLVVEDSGCGVPPGARNAVFEKFHQLQNHLTEKPQGTGLGLASSRAIVARFRGMIWCEDSMLGGAAFVVALPAVRAEAAAEVGVSA
jgi:signal transduction histidine kinase